MNSSKEVLLLLRRSLSLRPGPGRALIRLSEQAMHHHSTADYGGGRALALDTEEWSKVITERGHLDWGSLPPLPEELRHGRPRELWPALDSSETEGLRSGYESRADLRDELQQGLAVYRDLIGLAPQQIRYCYFAYAAYMEWRELVGSATINAAAMGGVTWLAVKWRDLIAVDTYDGGLIPLGNRYLGQTTPAERMLLVGDQVRQAAENGVYLLHTTRSLPLVYDRLAEGLTREVHHVEEHHLVATYRPASLGSLDGLETAA